MTPVPDMIPSLFTFTCYRLAGYTVRIRKRERKSAACCCNWNFDRATPATALSRFYHICTIWRYERVIKLKLLDMFFKIRFISISAEITTWNDIVNWQPKSQNFCLFVYQSTLWLAAKFARNVAVGSQLRYAIYHSVVPENGLYL